MKYVMTLFWTLIFGFVVGFIGSKLVKLDFNVQATLTVSVIFGILLNLVPLVLPKDPAEHKTKRTTQRKCWVVLFLLYFVM
ncbi:YjzD family protein [Latilactobacillus sakei]